jgi:hypothetical protein
VSADNSKPAAKPAADAAGSAAAPAAKDDNTTGRVKFDERGNAVWEWSIATGAFGREVSTERLQKLEHPALSLAEDSPTPVETARPNPLGTVKGYNPYDSGKLGKAVAPRKKDLRRLSEFLKLKKQAADNKDDE